MLWGGEAGTSPFVCTHRTYVAGRVRKLNIEVILSLLRDSRIQTSWISCNMLRCQNSDVPATELLFRKKRACQHCNMHTLHVPTTCPLVCADLKGTSWVTRRISAKNLGDPGCRGIRPSVFQPQAQKERNPNKKITISQFKKNIK